MPYKKYVAEHVFRRAEMTSTGYPHSDKPEPDIAVGYTRRGGDLSAVAGNVRTAKADGALRSNVDMHGATGSAAGGGYSTAMDLLTYVKAVRAGRFPGVDPNLGIAGGAPGTNAIVEAGSEWVTIVLSNFDPPTAGANRPLDHGSAAALRDCDAQNQELTFSFLVLRSVLRP